jgi:hypothetical protein
LGGKLNKPYGLDVWFKHKKVLNIEWDEAEGLSLVSYRPGPWEDALEKIAVSLA